MNPEAFVPLSRRRFLNHSLVLLSAAPLVLNAAGGSSKLKAAVIGHTGRGDYGHGMDEIFAGRQDVELVAVADANPDGLAKAAQRLKAPRSYADYQEMLRRERPQLVSVAPRHADQHRAMVLASLKAGAHVFCEKPFTTNPAEADELLAEADQRGLRIVVAHQMGMTPAVARLKTAVEDGKLGDLLELRGYGKQDARAGGEDMMVLGTHIFDLMRLFAGDPLGCSARVLWQGREITKADARPVNDQIGPVAGDEVVAQFSFAKGVSGSFTSRARQREVTGAWGLELIGSKGSARINAGIPPGIFLLKTSGWKSSGRTDEWQPFAVDAESASPGGSAFSVANARLVDDWLGAIREKRDPICSGRNGAKAVEMVMAVYQAALSRTRVAFPLQQRNHPLQ